MHEYKPNAIVKTPLHLQILLVTVVYYKLLSQLSVI